MIARHILIVEDEPNFAFALGKTLERSERGYHVSVVHSGEEALQRAGEERPDLALMDIQLAGELNGVETATLINARFDVPVVYLTGHSDDALLQRAKLAGPYGYLVKPVQDRDLYAAVEMALYKHELDGKLKESEERFRALVQASADLVTITGADGICRYASPSYERLVGHSPDELVGQNFLEFVHPGDLQRVIDVFTEILLRGPGARVAIEFRFLHKDGSYRWLEATSSNQLDNPTVVGVVSNARDVTERKRVEEASRKAHDELEMRVQERTTELTASNQALQAEITERKQAEEALRRERDFAESLIETAQAIVLVLDPDGRIVRFNPYMEELSGYKLDEVQGKDWFSIFLPQREHEPIRELFLQAINDIQTRGNVNSIVTKDGREREIEWYDKILKDTDGKTAGLLTIGQDITERKRAEETLRRRNEELAALNAITSAVGQTLTLEEMLNATLEETLAMLNVEGGLMCLFDEASQIFAPATQRGLSPGLLQEIGGFRMGEGLPGRAAQTGKILFVHDLARDPRDISPTSVKEGWYSLVCVPLRAKDKTVGVMTVASRVKNQFSSESLEMLTAIGRQIGVAIENSRLAEETSEIEVMQELARLRSELIANVSHELRTPLGLIKVFCTTLLREDVDFDSETRREFLFDIDRETERLEKIVDDLLDLSRIEDTRLHLIKHSVAVGQLAQEVVEAMRVQLEQHPLIHDFPSEPLMAVVDPKRVEQVIRNLLDNAIKYSPAGSAITVGGRGDDRQLLLWVRDQGIGIASEDLERVFERFYRVEDGSAQHVRGAGLGLAVCRGIVEAHGGRIWVESVPGEGSTFYFTLMNEARDVTRKMGLDKRKGYEQRQAPHSSGRR
jgi:PAS domain S-box-containing protein